MIISPHLIFWSQLDGTSRSHGKSASQSKCTFSFSDLRRKTLDKCCVSVAHLFWNPYASHSQPRQTDLLLWRAVCMWPITLLNFGTKCEGKFVPDSPTNNVATEHVQCTAAAGLGWWENRISSRLCQPIRGKLWFCQPMTGCSWEHATSWTTESDVF